MPSKKITLDRPYYDLTKAANYLTKKHGKDYYDSDILEQAIKGNISLCFYHESELGIFEIDNKRTGILKDESLADILTFEGTSFFFKGYIELPKDMVSASRESTTLLELNLLNNIEPSNPTPSKQSSQYYCGCLMNHTDGDRDFKYTTVYQKDIRISKEQLKKYSDSINPDIYKEQAHEITALKKRQSNLYKMLLTMAIVNYEYKPSEKSNKATGLKAGGILADVESFGIELGKNETKNCLDAAKAELISKLVIPKEYQ